MAPLESIRQMSRQVSRGSAGEYQADEQAGVARLRWGVSGRCAGRYLGSTGEYQADVQAGVARSAGEYQADEQAGVAGDSWRL